MRKKDMVDPRIDLIINAVEQENEPIDIPHLALKLNMDEQETKNIIGAYIKQQTNIKNLMFHRVEPRFFILAHGLQEFVEDKAIQKWLNYFYKTQGA